MLTNSDFECKVHSMSTESTSVPAYSEKAKKMGKNMKKNQGKNAKKIRKIWD